MQAITAGIDIETRALRHRFATEPRRIDHRRALDLAQRTARIARAKPVPRWASLDRDHFHTQREHCAKRLRFCEKRNGKCVSVHDPGLG